MLFNFEPPPPSNFDYFCYSNPDPDPGSNINTKWYHNTDGMVKRISLKKNSLDI